MARTDTLGHFLTDVADAIRTKTGSSDTIAAEDFDTEIENIPSGGGTKIFTGHYDAEGLSTIGWSSEEIQYYQDNGVQWNSSDDNSFKLTATELAGDDSSDTRFIPANSTKTLFSSYRKLLALPLLNTSSVTNMSGMFNACYSLTAIPLLDTSNVTVMDQMFNSCYSLETIPLIDVSKATNMNQMFNNCYSLKTLPLLNASEATDMSYMFYNCYSLKTISLLNTNKVTNMGNMFVNCYTLTTISSLDTRNVTSMYNMFKSCTLLVTIPLLDTSSVTSMGYMFSNCGNLSDTSLDNILQMCISATSYTDTKTLSTIGFASRYYPASKIQTLPHYQDFIAAGWTIGY